MQLRICERATNKNESIKKSVGLSVRLVAMGVGLSKPCKTSGLKQSAATRRPRMHKISCPETAHG